MSTENQITPAPKQQLTLRQHLEGDAFKDAVTKALPRHMTPDRFIRVALTAMNRTPKLRDCTQSSFLNALLSLSQLGLEPDGRRAHLIPYENRKLGVTECQLIVDWKGLSELIYRSGIVSTLHADVVRRGDLFDYSMGVLARHTPAYLRADAPVEAGEIYAVYAMATMKDGSQKTEVMSRDEVEAIRKRSRAGQSGPWVSDWNEMAKKTAFRRLSKWLPLSPELRQAVEVDDDAIEVETVKKASTAEYLDMGMTEEAPAAEQTVTEEEKTV